MLRTLVGGMLLAAWVPGWAEAPVCEQLGRGARVSGEMALGSGCARVETRAFVAGAGFGGAAGVAAGVAGGDELRRAVAVDTVRAESLRRVDSVDVDGGANWAAMTREAQRKITAAAIQSTAGTIGDPSRYFQVLAGVVSDNDQRNDFLVRGGNPSENLFVVDGIVVPSINHLALADTTGGFVSMLDDEAIESMTLHSGVHDAKFDDRLSAVIEIATVPEHSRVERRVIEAGLGGIGVIDSRPFGDRGSMMVSGRQGVLNLLTDDIGLNGVPKYSNVLLRGDHLVGEKDRVWGVSLTGVDSIAIRPSAGDPAETNPFDINYSGWRSTTGVNWQHTFSAKTFGVATVSDAEQAQKISEFDQLLGGTETYKERTQDGESTVKGMVTSEVRDWLLVEGGGTFGMKRLDYQILQAVPLPNPYSAAVVSGDATAIRQQFATVVEGGFLQGTIALVHDIRLTLGMRADHWGFGAHTSVTPRGLLSVPVKRHLMSVGYAEYAQMPAFLYLLAFPENRGLSPIRAKHATVDVEVLRAGRTKLLVSAYRKLYTDYPVAKAYPQLSLANIADTFGQSFLLFPMVSAGKGRVAGVEMTLETQAGPRVQMTATASYARAWYSGLDGVLRRGNYDIPLTANVTGLIKVGKQTSISLRYSGASGRPYTPDDLTESYAQNRDVYDLARVNRARSNAYGRFDFQMEQRRAIRRGELTWRVGLLNALGQNNFYAYLWQQVNPGGIPELPPGPSEQRQLPRFPVGDLKWSF